MAGVKIELDHSKMKIGSHEGLVMPECYEPLGEHLTKVKAMDLRDDDVMLCSYPKSGTHWLYRVVDMLQRGKAEYYPRTADSTFLDVQDLERMDTLASPRLIATHIPFDRHPTAVKGRRTKMVHVYRNPRAVLVSFYHMMKGMKMGPVDFTDLTIAGLSVQFFSEQISADRRRFLCAVNYSGWFCYMDKLLAFMKDNPDQPIFHVSYETMTKKPKETVAALAKFLGKPQDDAFYAKVVEVCSFDKQKATEEAADPSQAALKFYRKGDPNDWKNLVTVAVNEKFEEVLRERAPRCRFSAEYLADTAV